MDSVEQFLASVQPILQRNYGATTVQWVPDSTGLYENGSTPRIEWRYGSGRHEPSQRTGDISGAYWTDIQPLIARCWGGNRGDTRILKNNLLLACREIGNGATVRPGRYEWITEDGNNNELGSCLDVWIEIYLPVLSEPTAFPTQTFQVTSQTQATSVVDPATGHSTQA